MEFDSPLFFFLFPVLVAAGFYLKRRDTSGSIIFSTGRLLKEIKPTLKAKVGANLFSFRLVSLGFIIIALARPQLLSGEFKVHKEGIDIVLAVDVSTSMLAEDFQLGGHRVSRLEAVKNVVKDFIKGRENDRIGLVCFAGRAYVVSPLTLDHGWLMENLKRVRCGMIEDGTAIGEGLASALNRLKDTKAKSKVVILLTDGRNNAGEISPPLAAEIANSLGIKVYTIGAGSKGLAPYPVKDFFGNTVYRPLKLDIDEETLKEIAERTGGKYFRATSTTALRQIYDKIDKMEKVPIEEKGYRQYRQCFSIFLAIGCGFLLLEIILRHTVLGKIP
ncbi:MAG: aerotolerance regulator BatA [Candidatus Omnitrophica bacterium 4484_70.1]|nr:MAG: aerotolerance regulator BatA [Candidatus Omnitrophica bacterium 4484_70.1]